MKAKIIFRIIISALISVFLISIGTTVFAGEDPSEKYDGYRNDPEYTKWNFSDDGETLMGKGKTYKHYTLPTCYFFNEDNDMYYYANNMLVSSSKDSDIVWEGYSEYEYYATDAEQEKLSGFFDGNFENFEMNVFQDNTYAKIEKSFLSSLNDYKASHAEETKVYSVKELAYAETVYSFIAYDDSKTFCYIYGTVYRIDGTLCYLNLDALDNTHFDANGYLSYRRGNVTLLTLNEDFTAQLSETENSATYRITKHESEYRTAEFDKKASVIFYWFVHIAVGIITPLVFALIFACILIFGRRKNRRRLIIPLVLSLIWLLISVLIIPMLI